MHTKLYLRPAIVLAALMVALASTWTGAGQLREASMLGQATRPAGTVALQAQKWDYRILQDTDSTRLEREANRLGDQGFEMSAFQIVQPYAGTSASGYAYFVMVFKRPRV